MTRDEDELRRALEARSGLPSQEFRSRLSSTFTAGRPMSNALPAMAALAAAALITAAVVGVLVSSRQVASPATGGRPSAGPASGARTSPEPSPGQPVAGVLTPPRGSIPLPTAVKLSARSSYVAWALVADMYLYRSTDGGNTWQQRPVPLGPSGPSVTFFNDISFVDDQNGWLFAGGGGGTQCAQGGATVWRTSDAGTTWQRLVYVDPQGDVAHSIGFAQCKENISFVDLQHGFVDAWDDNGHPTIYATSDGGVNWIASTLSDPPGYVTLGSGDVLRAGPVSGFGGELLVDTSGNNERGQPRSFVFRSIDGGRTWLYLEPALGDEIFLTANRWLRVETSGCQLTVDAGQSWQSYPCSYANPGGVQSQFYFGDGVVGYGVANGTIEVTRDGGQHWSLIKTPGT
jgi:photosystem II stability/assembly factor-like uncharacterized protein